MKKISQFDNIEIYSDYDRPVIYACYNGEMATFDLLTCQIIEGSIDRYMILPVVTWLIKYQWKIWEMFKKKKFKTIPGINFFEDDR